MINKYYLHTFIDKNTIHTLEYIIKADRPDYLTLLDDVIKFKVFPFQGVNFIYIYSCVFSFQRLDLNNFYLVNSHGKTY